MPRTGSLWWLLAGGALALAACGDDDDGTTSDAGGSVADSATTQPDAAGPDAGPPSATFKVHYHRADGDYTGWTLATTAGAMETSATAGTPDGWGAVYSVTVTPGAPSLAFSLKKGSATDDAGALTVDVSGRTREAWIISGFHEAITRTLPALPQPGQTVVYYLRADTAYSGWGLHLWGDQVMNTVWTGALTPAGIDPEFGAGFVVDKVTTNPAGGCKAGNVCLIVHMGDTKDPGPDMTFDPKVLGNVVFVVTGSADITAMPRKLGDVGIAGMSAHLVDGTLLAWCTGRNATGGCANDAALTAAELRYSATAEIAAEGTEVTGGTVITLTPHAGALSAEQLAAAPYLSNASLWDIPAADRSKLAEAVKGQLVAVARKGDGSAGKATQVNNALYLDAAFFYEGPLGVTWTGPVPRFDVWAPTAQSVKLHVFDAARTEVAGSPFAMTRGATGDWSHTGQAGWKGGYYRYEVTVYHPATGKVEDFTVTDPYAENLSPNGLYAQIVDVNDAALKPDGWDGMVKPALAAPEDIVLYETHIRDFSVSDATTPADRRGKYLGFVTEPDATRSDGLKHLKALADAGLTHIHLLPAFDIATVDEDPANRVDLGDAFTSLCAKNSSTPAALCAMFPAGSVLAAMASFAGDSDQQQVIANAIRGLDSFNWGYDPFHYGAPEGSYASTADGTAKIVEFRRMVKGLNDLGLRVIMDVVYNHTNASGTAEKSVLDKIVPDYYHRLEPDSGFVLTSSCCANTASEHKMMERLIVDMSVRWARDYKVDGFRFDLMGLHMKSNMVKVRDALAALTPGSDGVDGSKLYVYGEGWDVGELARNARGTNATQVNMAGTGIGTFNDRERDGARGGGPFDNGDDLRKNQGFATGLYTNPNELSAASDANKELLAQLADLIKIGMAGGISDFRLVAAHGPTLNAAAIGYGGAAAGYTKDPQESINYTSAHDNQDLWDTVQIKLPTGTVRQDRVRSHDLALDVLLVGQGIPFIHAGDDILRSKSLDKNSYDSGDWFNTVDWSLQENGWKTGLPPQGDNGATWNTIKKVFMDPSAAVQPSDIAFASAHFQDMLKVRKSSPLFRLRTREDVRARVDFLNNGPTQVPGVIVMTISDGACAGQDLDPARDGVVVVVNGDKQGHTFSVAGATGAVLHPALAASGDAIVKQSTVSAIDVTVPGLTTAVFDVPQSGDRSGGPPCNTR